MTTGKVKNVVIILLGILSIYQIGGLWFEDMSSRNFFYTFFKTQNQIVQTLEQKFTDPKHIVIGFGNKNFNRFFIDEKGRVLNDRVDESIEYIMRNGEYLETKNIDWNELLSYKEAICTYSLFMPMDSYAEAMGAKSILTFSTKQETFDVLIIVPARSTGDYIKAYFINTDTNTVAVFSAKNNKFSDNLLLAIEDTKNSNFNTSYESTYQGGFELFNNNVFLPKINNKSTSYPSLKISNPYNTVGKVSLQSVENYVDVFFQNPVAKRGNDDKGVYIFSDENVVIRYYPSGLFEYSNYEMGLNDYDNSFPNAFSAALRLIRIDPAMHDNIYLSSVEQNEGGTWAFGFDYYIGDFPIILTDEIKKEIGIDHVLEIIVEKEIVSSYKYYACDVEVMEKGKTITVDFLTALNNDMENRDSNKTGVDNMYLAYKIINNDVEADLDWVIRIENSLDD